MTGDGPEPRRARPVVEAEARAVLCDTIARALDGDRTALDQVWPALPAYLATEIQWHWHVARARSADQRRKHG
jgi:hypothetical protein